MIIIYLIIGLILGGGVACLILIPKVKKTVQRNNLIIAENKDLEEKNKYLIHWNKSLNVKKDGLQEEVSKIETEYYQISARKDEAKNSLDDLQKQADQAADKLYAAARELAQTSFEKEIENINQNLDQERDIAKRLYLETMQDCVESFEREIDSKRQELSSLSVALNNERQNVDAAVEAAKRRQEMKDKKDFYRLVLPEADIIEIQRLREILPYLRDKTSLNKVIYKIYYERPLTDMIGRVVGPGTHTGIYKITNINNDKCYIGQAVNIANRWKQHCKRGVGAEDWTRNKLYPAMYEEGVENFTFEIVEECEQHKLNEKEDYWQEFFHAKDFGYSIK